MNHFIFSFIRLIEKKYLFQSTVYNCKSNKFKFYRSFSVVYYYLFLPILTLNNRVQEFIPSLYILFFSFLMYKINLPYLRHYQADYETL